MFRVPESCRLTRGPHETESNSGNNGAFVITLKFGQTAIAIASERDGWQHVAVSRTDRPMSYGELCQVKALFWSSQDCVLQFYPPDSERAPDQKFWLHLRRPIGCNLPMPAVELFAVPA